MNDLLLILAILGAWIALNRWVLPAMGIPTCMSGGCCGDTCRPTVRPSPDDQPADSTAADRQSG